MKVTYDRNSGKVDTFQPKVNYLPTKADRSDSFPLSKVTTNTDNMANKIFEEIASGPFKQEVPNFRFDVEEGVSLNQVSTKNQFYTPVLKSSDPHFEMKTDNNLSKLLEGLDSIGDSNNLTGAPSLFSSLTLPVKPDVLEEFKNEHKRELKDGSVATVIEKELVVKQSCCCVIS